MLTAMLTAMLTTTSHSVYVSAVVPLLPSAARTKASSAATCYHTVMGRGHVCHDGVFAGQRAGGRQPTQGARDQAGLVVEYRHVAHQWLALTTTVGADRMQTPMIAFDYKSSLRGCDCGNRIAANTANTASVHNSSSTRMVVNSLAHCTER